MGDITNRRSQAHGEPDSTDGEDRLVPISRIIDELKQQWHIEDDARKLLYDGGMIVVSETEVPCFGHPAPQPRWRRWLRMKPRRQYCPPDTTLIHWHTVYENGEEMLTWGFRL